MTSLRHRFCLSLRRIFAHEMPSLAGTLVHAPEYDAGAIRVQTFCGCVLVIPSRVAAMTACVRLLAPSARSTALTCTFTVPSASESSRQMSLLGRPRRMRSSTSIWRSVSPSLRGPIRGSRLDSGGWADRRGSCCRMVLGIGLGSVGIGVGVGGRRNKTSADKDEIGRALGSVGCRVMVQIKSS